MQRTKVFSKALATLLSLIIGIGMLPLSASARTAHPFTVVAGVPGDDQPGTGTGGSAKSSKLSTKDLGKIAVDSQGNLYIADSYNHAVRKVDTHGQMSTFFNGWPARDGNNYYQPSGVAVDSQDNVYIADYVFGYIIKYDSSDNYLGYIDLSSVPGTGRSLPRGICIGPDGCLYIAASQWNVVLKCDWTTQTVSVAVGKLNQACTVRQTGPRSATDACLNAPSDVTFDSDGNMYISDYGLRQILEVSGGQISVFAGSGDSGDNIGTGLDKTKVNIGTAESICFDSQGNAYISSSSLFRVLRIDAGKNDAYSFAGKGGSRGGIPQASYPEASSAQFYGVTGLAVGPDDSLYLCDASNHVSKVGSYEVTDPTVADPDSNTVQVSPSLTQPGGSVTITATGDGQNDAAQVETSQRYLPVSWSSSEPGKSGNLDAAGKATYTPTKVGSITITVTFKKQVYTGGTWTDATGTGETATKTADLIVGKDSPIVTTVGNGTPFFLGDGRSAVTSCLNNPIGIAYDSAGNMYIADTLNDRIRKVDTKGIISTFAGGGTSKADGVQATNAALKTPEGITFDPAGNLYVADSGDSKVREIAPNGIITTVAGCGQYGFGGDGSAAVDAKLRYPTGVALDSRGNLYIADVYDARIREVTTDGKIQTVVGCGLQGYLGDGSITSSTRLWSPCSVVTDKQDNLYIADNGAHCVFRVDAAHTTISSFAGLPTHDGSSGDGGQANLAGMSSPNGLVFDSDGNLYISDEGDRNIRKVYANGIIATVAGGGTSEADNVPAKQARLVQPTGLAIDPAGNLRYADTGRSMVRVVMTVPETIPNPAPTPVPAPSSGGFSAPSLPSSVADAPTSLQADLSGASFPASVTAISLAVTPAWPSGTTDQQARDAFQVMASSITQGTIGSPFLYNIKLLDQNGNPVTFTGSVTVKLPIPKGLRGTPHVFRYEPDTKTFTDMNAKVENGFLVFATTHFSYYTVAGMGNAITLDTLNYQMPVNGSYQIGVQLAGAKASSVKFHSTSDKIATVVKMENGNYQVSGKGTGTAYIMFDVYDGKNKFLTHASVRVDVKAGIRPRGDSTRQIGMF